MITSTTYSVLFCGSPAVGKTTTLHRLATGDFLVDHQPTLTSNSCCLRCYFEDNQTDEVELDVIEKSIQSQVSLADYQGVVLMLDVTAKSSYQQAKDFLTSHDLSDKAVLIVANKVDVSDWAIKRNRLSDLAQYGYVMIHSARTNYQHLAIWDKLIKLLGYDLPSPVSEIDVIRKV